MTKLLGSSTFGTTEMRTDEVVLFAQAAKENGATNEEILSDIHLIDDLLCLTKIRSIVNGHRFTKTGRIRRDSSLSDIINQRIEADIQKT